MARVEREWESTKLRLTFWRIFLDILPYKSFTKFGVCSKEDEKKNNFSGHEKKFFSESTSCKTTAPQVGTSCMGTYIVPTLPT